MRLRETGKSDGEIVTMGWDEAQAAILAGTHEVAEGGGTETGITRVAETGSGGATEIDLDAMTRAELEAHATERGVDISAAKTKGDVVEAIRTAP